MTVHATRCSRCRSEVPAGRLSCFLMPEIRGGFYGEVARRGESLFFLTQFTLARARARACSVSMRGGLVLENLCVRWVVVGAVECFLCHDVQKKFIEFGRRGRVGGGSVVKLGIWDEENFKNSVEFQRKGLLYEKIGVN